MLNGVTDICLTKLDILSHYKEIPLCTRYENDVPHYEIMQGWNEDIQHCRDFDSLPAACQEYILRIEELSGVSIGLIGVGPKRSESIIRTDTFRMS